jgi:hypothetical protein
MRKISIIIILGLLLAGCSKSIICFEPVKPYEPKSGAELLGELNSQIPFKVKQNNFMCKYNSNSDTLVGWIMTNTIEKKDIVKKKLKESSTLELLQVESSNPMLEIIFNIKSIQSTKETRPEK